MALVIEEMQMKTTLRHHLGYVIWNIASLGMAIKKKKKKENYKCLEGCGEIGTFVYCWWKCKMVPCFGAQFGVSSKS